MLQGARITKASHFDYEYVLGHKIVFICVAKGKPRPKIIWFKDGREMYDHSYLHVSNGLLILLTMILHYDKKNKFLSASHSYRY